MLKPIKSIYDSFHKEFSFLREKFNIIPLSMIEAKESKELDIAMPGVYIYWKDDMIIKVGRHLDNSRKRALEHIRENTRNDVIDMASLKDCNENCGIILINCKNRNDLHWVAAIEIYMENVLEPIIKSKRTG